MRENSAGVDGKVRLARCASGLAAVDVRRGSGRVGPGGDQRQRGGAVSVAHLWHARRTDRRQHQRAAPGVHRLRHRLSGTARRPLVPLAAARSAEHFWCALWLCGMECRRFAIGRLLVRITHLHASRSTRPSIPPGSVNEYQLLLGRQR